MVLDALRERQISSSSMVLSRPYPLQPGETTSQDTILRRLKRLGYQKSESLPEHPGQFQEIERGLVLYTRDTVLADAIVQPASLVSVYFKENKIIEEVIDTKFRKPVQRIWLEPEIVSLLGTDEIRASTPKLISDYPELLVGAVLAIEDDSFSSHLGVNPFAILRAFLVNVRSGGVVQGGSTITQQLAKNLFFSSERSMTRKAMEAIYAVLIEFAFTKQEILTFYLNEVFLGQEGQVAIHGFGEASESFFGKEVKDLSVAEMATLAGMIKAPSSYSPRRFPDKARQRRLVVLGRMEELKLITESARIKASQETLHVIPPQRMQRTAPFFMDYLRRRLAQAFDDIEPASRQIKIYSGIDIEYQLCAQNAVKNGVLELEKKNPRLKKKGSTLQAALVSVSPASGEIRAWVGGREYGLSQFDRVSQSKRQPGSTFKPFVYLTALDRGLNSYRVARTTSLLSDEPKSIKIPGGFWEPQNYDKKFRGDVTVREALAKSLNIPTIDLAMKIGVDSVARTAELFGFGKNLPRVPSLALGAGEVSPLEMARAYTAIANGGILLQLQPILGITLDDSEVIFQAKHVEQIAASEQAVFILTDMLGTALSNGTGAIVRRLGFTRPAAGKTGTSNDSRDAWFSGFTPTLLTVVWVGFDDNKETGLTGGAGAAPIWTSYMKCVSEFEPELDFIAPEGIVYREIDHQSGLLKTDFCPSSTIVTELFVEGTEPITPCPIHSGGGYERDDSFHLPPSRTAEPSRPSQDRPKSLWDTLFGSQ